MTINKLVIARSKATWQSLANAKKKNKVNIESETSSEILHSVQDDNFVVSSEIPRLRSE